MKQKLKLALVGAGERGQYCYAPYAKMHGYEIEFVAVADPHKGRREKFVQDYHVPAEGVFETAEQFFARPRMADAVLICTQDSQHYAYACQAIDLGYSILLEKLALGTQLSSSTVGVPVPASARMYASCGVRPRMKAPPYPPSSSRLPYLVRACASGVVGSTSTAHPRAAAASRNPATISYPNWPMLAYSIFSTSTHTLGCACLRARLAA